MSAVSRVFGGCRTLMAKAANNAAAAAASGGAGKEGKGILKTVPVSQTLASFAGESELSRATAVKKVWEHIKGNNLQNPENRKQIICDDKLKTIFGDKDTVGFTEIAKLLSPHFPKSV
ncbi:upstream activation factor subunit UAF30 [Raphanus sativus]|uniref:Upstream activation factor subunit UAF30 n=1 Tax=Raphanus sativus TaxID=3726 RepID=A0A6J0NSJ0_RAPSA|nr:upstream activation factor subunit UAF30 [Raphanus sativus]